MLVVDSGKQWVQVLDPDIEHQAILFLDGSQSPNESFDALADVAGDDDGNLYVVDRTQATVLKYDGDGELDQRVELNAPEGTSGHLQEPVAVTANTRLAFVFDRADGTVVAFELDQ